MKINLASKGGPEVSFMGFDNLTDEEIIYLMQRSPDPELMGGKLKQWLKRRKKRAKAFFGKVKKKFKKMPKWAKVAMFAPLAAPAIATGVGIAAAVKRRRAKERAMLAKMTPAQRAAYLKKKRARRRKAGRIASMFIPGVAPIAATAMAVKGIKKARRRRMSARRNKLLVQRKAALLAKRKAALAAKQKKVAAVKKQVTKKMMPVKAVPKTVPKEATPEKKKGGLAPILATAALALPLFLGQ